MSILRKLGQLDIIFRVRAATNTRALNDVDPAKIVRRQRAHQALSQVQLTRTLAGDLFWYSTQNPTTAYARDAEMSLHDQGEFVFAACFLKAEDPVLRWQQQDARQQRLVDHLDGSREIHVVSPGTDLRLNVRDRIWVNCSGQNNFPGGEVSTGPVEDQVEGHITVNFPELYGGREVRDIQSSRPGQAFPTLRLATSIGFGPGTSFSPEGSRREGTGAYSGRIRTPASPTWNTSSIS